jgi:hypothetical protein
MHNHFHLVVETPEANLVAGMAWLSSAYTIRLNHRHHLSGHVFSGRYKSLLVEGSDNGYLKTVCDDVHLNPVRAGRLKTEDRLAADPWSRREWIAYWANTMRATCDGNQASPRRRMNHPVGCPLCRAEGRFRPRGQEPEPLLHQATAATGAGMPSAQTRRLSRYRHVRPCSVRKSLTMMATLPGLGPGLPP